MDDDIRSIFIKFIVTPIFFIIGLLIVGTILQQALGWPGITKWIFAGVVLIIGLAAYVRQIFSE